MLPDSVEPRAKMKVTALQGPLSSSLDVSEVWRTSSAVVSRLGPPLGTGVAATAQMKAAMTVDWNFILELSCRKRTGACFKNKNAV